MSALRGGFQNLMHTYQGGWGVKKPQKYAYIVYERPLDHECGDNLIFLLDYLYTVLGKIQKKPSKSSQSG